MRVVVGVAGGIAAYKAVALVRLLREQGHSVRVIPTANALRFVGAPTWEALSGEPVSTDVFDDVANVAHVSIGQGADLMIVAPATADLLARAHVGRADDLLTATLLTVRCPVVMAPAMHTEMWQHPATVANVAGLRERGVNVIEPASGRLTGTDSGPGRLPEPADIVREALAVAAMGGGDGPLEGRHVVVSAGGTREPLDPVRFLGNRSSGRQGVALAAAAAARGAQVTLVAANVSANVLADAAHLAAVTTVKVESTAELRDAVRAVAPHADAVVMAAAVADFRPKNAGATKIKKVAGGPPPVIELVENPDILAELARTRLRAGQVVIGFAAETGHAGASVLELGIAKARRKGADLIVINQVGDGVGFAVSTNDVTIVDQAGSIVAKAAGSKLEVAGVIWDAVASRLAPAQP